MSVVGELVTYVCGSRTGHICLW